MYYEHDVKISMMVTTLNDEVTDKDIKDTFTAGHWDYEVADTRLITPAERVACIRDHIRRNGVSKYKYATAGSSSFAIELLDEVVAVLNDMQEAYTELL